MDFETIRAKLDLGQYEDHEDFANDVRLVFDNCAAYNSESSEPFLAGQNLRAIFEALYADHCMMATGAARKRRRRNISDSH